jgi:hypothetical protein
MTFLYRQRTKADVDWILGMPDRELAASRRATFSKRDASLLIDWRKDDAVRRYIVAVVLVRADRLRPRRGRLARGMLAILVDEEMRKLIGEDLLLQKRGESDKEWEHRIKTLRTDILADLRKSVNYTRRQPLLRRLAWHTPGLFRQSSMSGSRIATARRRLTRD